MARLNIDDSKFDQCISLRDSYKIMLEFVSKYYSRGETPISDFLFIYSGIGRNGETADPAAFDDYLDTARKVLSDKAS